jgi:hypothetical protein
LWEIERDDEARRVLVEISRSALASSGRSLPGDTEAAIATEGHSELVSILNMDDPPRVISCTTAGCRHRTADDLGD